MPANEDVQPHCSREDALAVLNTLRQRGFTAYFAGGCVRDTLLGLTPKDWDVATDAPPDRVRQIFRNTQAVGASFGVILVRYNGSTIEVATFRTDGDYSDGRHPDRVQFATPEADAQRRDFTINGLFYDPLENRVIDFVGGQEDLKAKTLRAIGDPEKRFAEDYLRMLRAVRFAARFRLTIEPKTVKAIVDHAPKLTRISPERICDELRAMLPPPTRSKSRDLLAQLKLLPVILRGLPEGAKPDDPHDALGQLSTTESVRFPLALAALLIDLLCVRGINCPDGSTVRAVVDTCRRTLKISNDESDHLAQCLNLEFLRHHEEPRVSVMKRFLAQRFAQDALTMFKALTVLSEADAAVIRRRVAMLEALSRTEFAPTAFVTGDDLVSMGYSPGPKFKTVLDSVYDAQLEDRISTKQSALQLAREMMSA